MFIKSLRRELEAVLSGHKGALLQTLAWNVLHVHPTFRAARWIQQGHISAPLRLLSGRTGRSALGKSLRARLNDMVRFLDYDASAPTRASVTKAPFNARVVYAFHSCNAFHPNGYGSRSVALVNALANCGVTPVVTVRPGYPWDLVDRRDAPKRTDVYDGGLRFRLVPEPELTIHAPESQYIDAYSRYLCRLAQEYGVSLIHAASNYLNGAAAAQAGRELGIASIYEVRGLWHLTRACSEESYFDTEHYRYCEAREIDACQQADQVIVISEGLRKWLIGNGVCSGKISVVGNAACSPTVNLAESTQMQLNIRRQLGIPANAKVVGYLGSILEYEGLDLLLYAHARTPAARRPYLLLVGSGRHEEALRKLAKNLGIESTTIFTGRVKPNKVSEHYAAMDAVVLPRRDHILTRLVPPIKPFEILAHGRPLFVSAPLAQALGDTLAKEYQVIDLESVERLDSLVTASAPISIAESVPTWINRAEEVLEIYHRISRKFQT